MNKTDYKPKNQGVKFDFLAPLKHYAFTINPKQECKSSNIKGWYRDQWNELRSIIKGCSAQLHLESSPTGRLHWHGYIKVTNVADFRSFLYALALHGTYVIKEQFEGREWEEYIQKQRNIWSIIVDGWKDPNLTYPLLIDTSVSAMTIINP